MRYGLDILMFVLLVGEMAFFYLPPLVHEAVGVAFLLPILWHLVLNRRYVSSLGRGRWNGLRSNPSLYQLHGTAAHYFLVLAGLHLGWHLPAWWQRWLHAAGITARPLPARMLLLGLGGLLGAGGIYAAQQDLLIERLQGAHVFMAPALSYSGAGYALAQVGIIIVFAEIGWLLSLWKGARLK